MSMTIQEAVDILLEYAKGMPQEGIHLYDAIDLLEDKRLCDADEACRVIRELMAPNVDSSPKGLDLWMVAQENAIAFLRENERKP